MTPVIFAHLVERVRASHGSLRACNWRGHVGLCGGQCFHSRFGGVYPHKATACLSHRTEVSCLAHNSLLGRGRPRDENSHLAN